MAVTGKLNSRAKVMQVIYTYSGLPLYLATFSSSEGTFVIFFSGYGYSILDGRFIGMSHYIDGTLVDSTGVFARQALTHSAHVAKQWVLTGVSAGMHSLSPTALNADNVTDANDIFFVTVMEMPF